MFIKFGVFQNLITLFIVFIGYEWPIKHHILEMSKEFGAELSNEIIIISI